jgi:hypothetical protein
MRNVVARILRRVRMQFDFDHRGTMVSVPGRSLGS